MKSYKKFIEDKFIFENFLNIDSICKKYFIKNYTINSDNSVDVDGGVHLSSINLRSIPLKFGKVGDFYCSDNLLISLEGSPRETTDGFCCDDNKLTSLEGGPNKIGKDFNCSFNKLTSLKGGPEFVSRHFFCTQNRLESLEGSPKSLSGDFYCSFNQLTSLEGGPTNVNDFYCNDNQLTSLVGCPEKIGDYFNCDSNKITDFRGVSEFFEEGFSCDYNPISSIYYLFNDVRCIRWINEFDVIRGTTIIMDRLEEVYHQLGMDEAIALGIPKSIKLKNYEII
jgi:hypothetical protein